MKDALKWLAILGGGYYLFRDQINSLISSTSSTATTSATTTAAAAAAAATAAAAQQAAATAAAQHAAANPTDQAAQAAAAAAAKAAQDAQAQQAATAAAAQAAAAAKAKADADAQQMLQQQQTRDAAQAAVDFTNPALAAAEARNAPNPSWITPAILTKAVENVFLTPIAGTTHLTGFEWNYYANAPNRAAGVAEVAYASPSEYLPAHGLDANARITAAEYLAWRPAPGAGMNGLPGLRAWRFKNYA